MQPVRTRSRTRTRFRTRTRLPLAVAAANHGVLTSDDLRRHGLSRSAIENALRQGHLERLGHKVYAVQGSPDSVERRATAATICLRGALSHRSATGWWNLPGFEIEPLHVMRYRPGSSEAPPPAVLHRPVRLLPRHLTVWRGVAVTRPARTLFDLAATVHPALVERTYDTMWSRGLITAPAMERMLRELQGRGRPGIQLMRALIDDRRGLSQPVGSRLEQRFETLNRRAGIPMLRRQISAGDDENWIGRMDFVGEQRALVVEIDSAMHHAALLDTRRDSEVTAGLEAAGWLVCRWGEDDLWNDGTRVIHELRSAWDRAPKRP